MKGRHSPFLPARIAGNPLGSQEGQHVGQIGQPELNPDLTRPGGQTEDPQGC